MRLGTLAGWLGLVMVGGGLAAADDREPTPPEFAPFEHMVGGWKGQGVPAKNRLKGWSEKHNWAWKFAKGKAVGMAMEATGDKILTKAQLSFDPATKAYRLEGTDAEGKPVAYVGPLDEATHTLTLDREDPPKDLGKEQIALALNENMIRYTLRLFRQEPDAPQFAKVIEVGMGKEGESFAAGGAAADLPKCIVTGGASSMTASYMGKTVPLCCTGCRDEFNDNPEKYMKKLALRMEKGEPAPAPAAAREKEEKAEAPAAKVSAKGKVATKAKDAAKPKADAKAADPAAKANSLLSQGQSMEKSGNTSAALGYYRRIVKEYADTDAAKTATSRIKALGKK